MDFTEARDSEWQWHQLGHMQVCTSLQTDNHASTSPLSFLQAGRPSCHPTNSQSTVGKYSFHKPFPVSLPPSELTQWIVIVTISSKHIYFCFQFFRCLSCFFRFMYYNKQADSFMNTHKYTVFSLSYAVGNVIKIVKWSDIVNSSLQSCHTATETHMPYRITQCYMPPNRGNIPTMSV